MEAKEYQELIELFQVRLRENGLADIASVADVIFDPELDDYRASPAKERLIAMLTSFDRHLAARDPATLDFALERINRAVDGRIESALFDPLVDTVGADARSLRSGVPRRPLRDQVVALVRTLLDD